MVTESRAFQTKAVIELANLGIPKAKLGERRSEAEGLVLAPPWKTDLSNGSKGQWFPGFWGAGSTQQGGPGVGTFTMDKGNKGNLRMKLIFSQAAVYVLTTQCCVESLRGLRQTALTVPILSVMYIYFLIHWWGLAQKWGKRLTQTATCCLGCVSLWSCPFQKLPSFRFILQHQKHSSWCVTSLLSGKRQILLVMSQLSAVTTTRWRTPLALDLTESFPLKQEVKDMKWHFFIISGRDVSHGIIERSQLRK